jgi:L-asparaginase II
MGEPVVVEVVRSGMVESEHLFDVAVVDAAGTLVAGAGDPDRFASYRSSAKPIQATVALECGFEPRDVRSLALACASHNAEPAHVDGVRAVLEAAGLSEGALRCPEAFPMRPVDVARAERPARILHNCSGKHAAMLATCVAAGWPLETYRDQDHPLQWAIRDRMRQLLGTERPLLVDGCGVPAFVAPLCDLARGFGSIADSKAADAMRADPFAVAGTDRVDTDLMTSVPGVVSKGGAEGLTCVAMDGYALALKARDGTSRGIGPAVIATMRMLGLAGHVPPALEHPAVLGGGRPVGELRVRSGPSRV